MLGSISGKNVKPDVLFSIQDWPTALFLCGTIDFFEKICRTVGKKNGTKCIGNRS